LATSQMKIWLGAREAVVLEMWEIPFCPPHSRHEHLFFSSLSLAFSALQMLPVHI
jgi:hypothetical protein